MTLGLEKRKETSRGRLIIAIDGPSAAGKSTVGRLLAERLGYLYVDTGAMYRGLAWKFLKQKVDISDLSEVQRVCRETNVELVQGEEGLRVFVDQKDVTEEIRLPEVGMVTSQISSIESVRRKLLDIQRKMGERGGLVMEGRDIGTVVFPHAHGKFFLDATTSVRGERRYLEFQQKGIPVNLAETISQIEERDRQDRQRKQSPLRCAEDAIRIDSSQMTIGEVVERMVQEIQNQPFRGE